MKGYTVIPSSIIESDYIEYQKILFRYLTIKKIYIEYPVMLPHS